MAQRTAKKKASRTSAGTKRRSGDQIALTSVIMPEDGGFVSLCPELDVASQGDTIQDARADLIEAVELLLETASQSELKSRLLGTAMVSPISVRRRA
jgi:predicted RNase H-like HicB family nuclease